MEKKKFIYLAETVGWVVREKDFKSNRVINSDLEIKDYVRIVGSNWHIEDDVYCSNCVSMLPYAKELYTDAEFDYSYDVDKKSSLSNKKRNIKFLIDNGIEMNLTKEISNDDDNPEILSVRKLDIEDVEHPKHYNYGDIETLDIISEMLTEEEFKGYLKGNIIKYRERHPYKGQAETDLKKAKFYWHLLKKKDK